MKNKYLACAAFIMVLVGMAAAQDLEGYFYLDDGGLDCRVENTRGTVVIIEGLKNQISGAKFYSEDGSEVDHKIEHQNNLMAFQEWTRLLPRGPEGKNQGSIHRVITAPLKVEDKKKDDIAYLIFDVKVYEMDEGRRVSKGERVKVRLDRK